MIYPEMDMRCGKVNLNGAIVFGYNRVADWLPKSGLVATHFP